MSDDSNKTPEELEKDLRQLFGELEAGRLQQLDQLRSLRIASQALLANEAARLRKKLGADHPRVRSLEMRMKQDLKLVEDLDTELEVAQVSVPQVEEQDVLIHGRVVDEHQRGMGGLTVFLADDQGKAVRSAGSAVTDAVGYYAFRVDPATLVKINQEARGKVYLAVATRAGSVIHRETAALKLEKSARLYTDMNFTREDLRRVGEEEKPSGTGGAPKPPKPSVTFVVRGRVLDASGEPVRGVLVRLFDKDRKYDDLLGAATTDRQGAFKFSYRSQDFKDFAEEKPDLYLIVTDLKGETLYSSEAAVRFDVGEDEEFEIRLKAE